MVQGLALHEDCAVLDEEIGFRLAEKAVLLVLRTAPWHYVQAYYADVMHLLERVSQAKWFKSRTKRDAVLHKAKKARLSNKDIGSDNTQKIYVNEHLCPTLKRLLGIAIGRKRDNGWKSVWSYNGKIFARKSDETPIVRIEHDEDLSNIC
ncbi:hypothetical protein HPB50_023163 [Hyalomma asiaticum]|uniref:Uncharacterized protein n=1 Tax=Hyalomma asiaticum TaxID=266040 RepID=A0ACB7T9B5_HYAAI|nr:hypothetical protein HPB50_023163 [Hyalomma asiaticum]